MGQRSTEKAKDNPEGPIKVLFAENKVISSDEDAQLKGYLGESVGRGRRGSNWEQVGKGK